MGLGFRDLLGEQNQGLEETGGKRVELQNSGLSSTKTLLHRGASPGTSLCRPEVL